MKKGVNGRRKGANYELKIAKLFGEAFGMEFRRTPLSGGWAKGNPGVSGDLVCMDLDPGAFPWHIECKRQEGWKLESIFTDKKEWLNTWWKQASDECPKGKRPVLVFGRNRVPDLAMCKYYDIGTPAGTYIKTFVGPRSSQSVIIMALHDFLDLIDSWSYYDGRDDE